MTDFFTLPFCFLLSTILHNVCLLRSLFSTVYSLQSTVGYPIISNLYCVLSEIQNFRKFPIFQSFFFSLSDISEIFPIATVQLELTLLVE